MSERGDCCRPDGDCGPNAGQPNRREFLGTATVAALGVLQTRGLQDPLGGHFVPADKKLTAEWVAKSTARGPVPLWRGGQLRTVAMPCGGVASGQLYVTGDMRGDGLLLLWLLATLLLQPDDRLRTSSHGRLRVRLRHPPRT